MTPAELWRMVAEWQSLRNFERFNINHATQLRAVIDAPKDGGDVGFAKEQAAAAIRTALDFGERALELRWLIVQAVGELTDAMGNQTPRSLREFGVLLRPHGDEQKALDLWASVQVDLECLPQDDKKHDTEKKSEKKLRPMTLEARACVRNYKRLKKTEGKASMRAVVRDYVDENGGSEQSIMRTLNDNSHEWKDDKNAT